ncbi:MAG: hypothetical protein KA105_08650 [Caulobacter sp.]|nr:hypothetical protein [Caulobacter sp.]
MIRQFDLVASPGARQRPNVPYMVILQSHHLSMETTVADHEDDIRRALDQLFTGF